MGYDPHIHRRKSIRLKNYDYSQAGLYFVTIATQKHECLFGKITDDKMTCNSAGDMVNTWYDELNNKFPHSQCREMIVMPNHIHFIIAIQSVGADLCVCPGPAVDAKPPKNVNSAGCLL